MISLLVVNYRTSALAAEAIRSARAATSQPLQVVVVDNSLDAREAEALRPHADVLVVSATNRGYAGGINDGRKACRGEVIVVSNPDVVFAPGCLDALAGALDVRTAVAGPALFWDDAHRWHLPPADLVTGWEKLDEVLASRSRRWFAERDRRRFLARVAFWSLTETTRVRALSGAVLAIRAEDFDEAGGFDERFALYFEENDFLRRIAAMRRRIVYVPSARCRHLYNQSAGQDPAAAGQRYMESEAKYLAKWNGPLMAQWLKSWERPIDESQWSGGRFGRRNDDSAAEAAAAPQEVVTEVSPLPTFATAAGCFGDWPPPQQPGDPVTQQLFLRTVVRATGEILATYRITP